MRSLRIHGLAGILAGLLGCGLNAGSECPSGRGLATTSYTGHDLEDAQVALSFDVGPGPALAPVDDYLTAAAVPGSFFVLGKAVNGSEAQLAALKAHGHLLGNGGFTGVDLNASVDPVTEIRRADALLSPYASGNAFLLRHGGGNLSAAVVAKLNQAGLSRYVGHIAWDIGNGSAALTEDHDCWTNSVSVSDCAQGYLTAIRAQRRGIVRLHADQVETSELLRVIVPKLKLEKFQFVRLDAVASIRNALLSGGATPMTVGGAKGCYEY